MDYRNKGFCIFCGKDATQTTFKEKPHTMPKSLGSISIGVDICDECNHYFGQPDNLVFPKLCIEVCVKEIFSLMKTLLNREDNPQRLKSIYFEYWKAKRKIVLKSHFKFNDRFLITFARQFKRGIYEMFLQEYHKITGNGLDNRFNQIRKFARYNIGDIPLYYLVNNGIILVEDTSHPKFPFSESQFHDINTYVFYTFFLCGQWFFLEVTPRAELSREVFLSKQYKQFKVGGAVYSDLIEIIRITDIDFSLRRLLGRTT